MTKFFCFFSVTKRRFFRCLNLLISRTLIQDHQLINIQHCLEQALAAQRSGNSPAALETIDRAIRLAPRTAPLHDLRAQILSTLGRHPEAVEAAQRAVRLDPKSPTARRNLGDALLAAKRFDQAAQTYRLARALDPTDVRVHRNLGLAYAGQLQWPEAAAALRAALRLAPEDPGLHLSLGAALDAAGDRPASAASYAETLRRQPGNETAINRLARSLIDQNRLDEAEAMLRAALPHRADVATAWNDIGNSLICQGRLEEAAACIDQALAREPDLAVAHYNQAVIAFGTGRYANAWREWEWRWRRPGKSHPALPGKPWNSEPLNNQRLLIHEEEGLGDYIQFCRFVPLAAEHCEVSLRVPPALKRLVRSLKGAHTPFAPGTEPPCDLHISLLSLPAALNIDLATLPTAPYLHPEPDLVASWRARLAPLPGLRVGLAWAGNPAYVADHHRSLSPDLLSPFAGTPGVSFVSLQVGGAPWTMPSPEQRAALNLYDPTAELADLSETAALIAALDLVITVDSALAHLAGAIGHPVWLLNRFNTDWRWLRGHVDSPWYPSMRIFAQKRPGDWSPVIAEASAALREIKSSEGKKHLF